MDWKWQEKGLDALYIGSLTLLGSFLVKKIKSAWNGVEKITALGARVDKLEKELVISKRELAVSKSKKMVILQIISEPILIMDTNADVIFANPAFVAASGFANIEDSFSRGYVDAIHEKDKKRIEQGFERLVKHPLSWGTDVKMVKIGDKEAEIINTHWRCDWVHDDEENLIEIIIRISILK